ncbi:hypothetical protein [Methanimicrococcus hongohii]|uniref:hypothetical protein n=1 Tax=Methanimicrococcus hongohii TaxID=3028295 RepID=UPI00292DCAE5|nr:hypothetical protein [Methanimicrococcus sp. Hf6]
MFLFPIGVRFLFPIGVRFLFPIGVRFLLPIGVRFLFPLAVRFLFAGGGRCLFPFGVRFPFSACNQVFICCRCRQLQQRTAAARAAQIITKMNQSGETGLLEIIKKRRIRFKIFSIKEENKLKRKAEPTNNNDTFL